MLCLQLRALSALSNASLRDLYRAIAYLPGHLDFISISHTDRHGKYHSVLGEMYQSRPTWENTNTLGVSQRNLIQKFDYTGDGITKEANRRYWGNSVISHSQKPLGQRDPLQKKGKVTRPEAKVQAGTTANLSCSSWSQKGHVASFEPNTVERD